MAKWRADTSPEIRADWTLGGEVFPHPVANARCLKSTHQKEKEFISTLHTPSADSWVKHPSYHAVPSNWPVILGVCITEDEMPSWLI